jgi:hypothetical protein
VRRGKCKLRLRPEFKREKGILEGAGRTSEGKSATAGSKARGPEMILAAGAPHVTQSNRVWWLPLRCQGCRCLTRRQRERYSAPKTIATNRVFRPVARFRSISHHLGRVGFVAEVVR